MKEKIKTRIIAYSVLIIFHAIILILFFRISNEKCKSEEERPYKIIPADSVEIINGNLALHKG
jgi:predicted RND superfamily exporter protein